MIGAEKKELQEKARQLRNRMTKYEIKLWSGLRSRQVDGYTSQGDYRGSVT